MNTVSVQVRRVRPNPDLELPKYQSELAAGLDIGDRPSHVFVEDGEKHQQPCAEVSISESAGEAILEQGTMALLSYRNRNAVRLLRWQSIAEPLQQLRGAWVSA